MNKLSTERAIEALYTVRAYYASLTAGYPKGKDCRGIDDVTCSEIANSCLMAIKSLRQEPVIDKIRAEIKTMSGDVETLSDVLDIIDKHLQEIESEEKSWLNNMNAKDS